MVVMPTHTFLEHPTYTLFLEHPMQYFIFDTTHVRIYMNETCHANLITVIDHSSTTIMLLEGNLPYNTPRKYIN